MDLRGAAPAAADETVLLTSNAVMILHLGKLYCSKDIFDAW
jgi:hypothetical protein